MQRFCLPVVVVVFGFLLAQQACTSRTESAHQSADSVTAPNPAVDYTPQPITGRLADLGLTRDSHWRGINLGDEFGKVKATEKGEAFESDAKHVGYTVEFKTLETADMLYYQQKGNVSAIDVDLFLNNRQSVDGYQNELKPYFTTRYGTPKPGLGGTVWNGPAGEQILLKDVSKGKDFGLKIKIVPADQQATASAK